MNVVHQEIELPRSEAGKHVSEEEYWEKYYEYVGESDFKYEWNNGVLEEKPGADFLYVVFRGVVTDKDFDSRIGLCKRASQAAFEKPVAVCRNQY